jgi:hypothetical protein
MVPSTLASGLMSAPTVTSIRPEGPTTPVRDGPPQPLTNAPPVSAMLMNVPDDSETPLMP